MRDEEKTKEQLLSENQSLRKELADLKASAECECKWIEAALKESEERYRRLLESITDYIYTVKGENGRPVSTTHGPGCLAVTGYTSEYFQIHSHLWYEMIHEDDREEVLKQIEKVLSGGAVQPIEHRIIHKDGSIRCIRNTTVPHFDKDGKLIAYDGIIEDITDRKRAEEKIGEAETRYRTIFEQSPAGVLIIDPETFLPIEFNDTACRQLGYSQEEFAKLHVWDYEAISSPEQIKAGAEKLLLQKKDFFETKHRTKNGEIRNVLVTIQSLILSGKHLFHCVFRDITEIRRAEERMKEEMEVTSHLLMIAEATARVTDVGGLRKEIVACVQKILGCEICLLYVWDAEAKRFNPEQESGLAREDIPQFMTETLNSNMMFVKRVLSGKEPIVIARSVDDFLMIVGDERKGLALSWLPFGDTIAGILLVTKKAPLGFVLAVFKQEKDFKDRDLQVMRGMSSQVSIAIEQARLYREAIDKALELSHKMETIKVMSQIDRGILSTLDPQEILETATMMISRVVSCDRATVALADKERKEFLYAAGFGTTAIAKGIFVPFEDTSAAKVLETGRPEYIANLERIGELLPLETAFLKEGFLSHMRHPLIVKEEVVGVLSIGSKRPSAFTPTDLSTIEKLAYQIGVALQNARQLKDLEDLFLGTVKSLSAAIDAKSPWTAGHSERVTRYALDIAKQMGLPENELKDLELVGLLHDVGKIGTYEAILDKPGKLEPDEIEIVRRHPGKGAEILEPIRRFGNIIPAIKHHHEFYDGTGYPDKLKGEDIPLLARILAVADTYDAMKADRPYRPGRKMEYMISEFKRCSGTQFDPKVAEAFLYLQAADSGNEKKRDSATS